MKPLYVAFLLLVITVFSACSGRYPAGSNYTSAPQGHYPVISARNIIALQGDTIVSVKANNIPAIIARADQNVNKLLAWAGISKRKFAEYNDTDLLFVDDLLTGAVYYLKPKKGKGIADYHWVQKGQSMWDISQMYGVKLDRLLRFNRMNLVDEPEAGRKIYLRKKRPAGLFEVDKSKIRNKNSEPFEWVDRNDKPYLLSERQPVTGIVDDAGQTAAYDLKPENPNATFHTVKEGENIFRIARMYNVTVLDLAEWNAISAETATLQYAVKPGDLLRVKPIVGAGMPVDQPQETAGQEVLLPTSAGVQISGVDSEGQATRGATGAATHIVKKGETVYQLARIYNVPVKELMALNGFNNTTMLQTGQQVIIPGNSPEPAVLTAPATVQPPLQQSATAVAHVVKKGETLFRLSRQYNISVEELMALNGLNSSEIQTGQQLIVSKGQANSVFAPAASVQPGNAQTATPNYNQPAVEAPAQQQTAFIYHTVQPQDNVYELARLYKVPVSQLRDWNNLKYGDELKVGQPIIVGNK